MLSQQNPVGLLDKAEVQHQTIKVCVLGKDLFKQYLYRLQLIDTCANTDSWAVGHTVAVSMLSPGWLYPSGRGGCGKSKVIQALTGNDLDPPCQTLGLYVTTCWWDGGQQTSPQQSPMSSLFEFWEVQPEALLCILCKHMQGLNAFPDCSGWVCWLFTRLLALGSCQALSSSGSAGCVNVR